MEGSVASEEMEDNGLDIWISNDREVHEVRTYLLLWI